jgi:hypothetical protein
MHNEELQNLYSLAIIIRTMKSRRMRWAGYVIYMANKNNAYRVLARNPEEKKPLGRPRHRWEKNIKMQLTEIGCGDMDCLNLDQDRDQWGALVNTVMNHLVP